MYLTSNIFLFSSVVAARDIAYIVRGEWDGCNGVVIENPDLAAFETATELLDAEYCCNGDDCFLSKTIQPVSDDEPNSQKHFFIAAETGSGKSVVPFHYVAQLHSEQLHNQHQLEINFLRLRNEEP